MWPLETSFDDPGSIVGDADSVVNNPSTNQDSQNSRGNIMDFNQVFQYENISVRLSSKVNSSLNIQHRVSSPSTESDCDSGSYSLCSAPGNLSDRNTAQAKLLSPAIVLSVIKETPHCDNHETERLKMEQINRQNSMSPREKLIHDKMRYQERLREEQLKEEVLTYSSEQCMLS